MGKYVSGGFAPRHELAVVPDKAVAVGHRHNQVFLYELSNAKRDSSLFGLFYEVTPLG
jgi:hypothetical protein